MNRLAIFFSALTLFTGAALAAPIVDAPTRHETQQRSSGEVIKVDKDSAKITIKHGPLFNLNMPGMTMAFKVRDAAMLDQAKAGDKISFVAEKVNGALTVTTLEPVK